MAKRKTHDEFTNEVLLLVNNEYTILSNYINAKTKIKIRHNTCNYSWDVIPETFLRGSRCRQCSGNIKKDNNVFKIEVNNLWGRI